MPPPPASTVLVGIGSTALFAVATTLGKRVGTRAWSLITTPHANRRKIDALSARVDQLEQDMSNTAELITREVLPLLRSHADLTERTSKQIDHLTQSTIPDLFSRIGRVQGRQDRQDAAQGAHRDHSDHSADADDSDL